MEYKTHALSFFTQYLDIWGLKIVDWHPSDGNVDVQKTMTQLVQYPIFREAHAEPDSGQKDLQTLIET